MTIAYRTTVLVNAHIMPKITGIIGVFIVLKLQLNMEQQIFDTSKEIVRHVEQKTIETLLNSIRRFLKMFRQSNKVEEK